MNKKILSTLTLGIVLFSFVACSQDDGTDGNNGGVIEMRGEIFFADIRGSNTGDCGDKIIAEGTVYVYGGYNGAGIGSACSRSCGNITISDDKTTVYAYKGCDITSIGNVYHFDGCGTIIQE